AAAAGPAPALPAAPLHRRWHNRAVHAPRPTEAQILAILQELGFKDPADTLDCGACGYATCRELAIAIHQGRGEVDQCLPLALERLERSRQEIEKSYHVMQREFDSHFGIDFIVGKSPQMQEIHSLVMKVAPTPTTVLIRGESGTGKELIARAIHQNSPLRDRPLVTLNCTAIPEGLLESELFGHVRGAFTGAVANKIGVFEAADGGTLFLDEIGDMPLALQAKLMRVLQTGEIKRVGEATSRTVRVRLIAATNRDLEADIKAGRFREDLYYRLNIVSIELPPLRARRGDIPLLAEHFLKRARAKLNKTVTGISREALAALRAYSWPGNIRELENVIERAVVLAQAGRIEPEHLPENVRAALLPTGAGAGGAAVHAVEPETLAVPEAGSLLEAKRRVVDRFERAQLLAYLSRAGGNISQAARLANIPRRTFHRLLAKHGLSRADYVSLRG
ncbi:MAG TPA: sigma 54-interacting transcriptional regulator, partial [Thermodesulfobacteriota bacterium]|nr:sigma 54-interacting transcriptional regulator [Thermodesulfobacteriota bacterium]